MEGMMAARWQRWSDDEISALARFVLKRHDAGAEFFARSRACMFEQSGDADDAARWHAVAVQIDALQRGNVAPLRPYGGGSMRR
jgi:hypothetical protein